MNSQWIENFAELTFDSEPVTISLLTDWQVNDYEAQVERKPQILLQSVLNPGGIKISTILSLPNIHIFQKEMIEALRKLIRINLIWHTRRVPPKTW